MDKKAVVLLSGGLDSTTVLAIARKEHDYECHTMAFNYSQRHHVELEYAKRQSKLWEAETHRVINVDMTHIQSHNFDASLVNQGADVPEYRSIKEMGEGIPNTYVPARNTIFLAYAVSLAEVVGAERIYIGVNALDYSGYPDCRPEYIEAYQCMLDLATKKSVEGNSTKIIAPLINMTKAQIIMKGLDLGVDYDLTNSCYNPKVLNPPNISRPCHKCDSCLLRAKGFEEANREIGILNKIRNK